MFCCEVLDGVVLSDMNCNDQRAPAFVVRMTGIADVCFDATDQLLVVFFQPDIKEAVTCPLGRSQQRAGGKKDFAVDDYACQHLPVDGNASY